MKMKKTLSILAVCMLVFITLSAVMVYAPKPEDDGGIIPFQNVIVVNLFTNNIHHLAHPEKNLNLKPIGVREKYRLHVDY